MTPALIAVLLGTSLLALLPTRRVAERTQDRWAVLAYYLALWMLIAAAVLVPATHRFSIPLVLLLAIAPFITLRAGLARLLGRPPPAPRRPPRNVTPPDA